MRGRVGTALLVKKIVPAALVAVTTTRSVRPTSALLTAYVEPVAPETAAQLAPLVLHRCHW